MAARAEVERELVEWASAATPAAETAMVATVEAQMSMMEARADGETSVAVTAHAHSGPVGGSDEGSMDGE
jgi:hypothetical protein